MANDKKKMVEAITAQEVDFAQWYTDICTKAELVEYSSVKGFVVLRPYGYAIWENIQKNLDARFKATGHENVAMPVPVSYTHLAASAARVGPKTGMSTPSPSVQILGLVCPAGNGFALEMAGISKFLWIF